MAEQPVRGEQPGTSIIEENSVRLNMAMLDMLDLPDAEVRNEEEDQLGLDEEDEDGLGDAASPSSFNEFSTEDTGRDADEAQETAAQPQDGWKIHHSFGVFKFQGMAI